MIKQRMIDGHSLFKLLILDQAIEEKNGLKTASEIDKICKDNGFAKPYICSLSSCTGVIQLEQHTAIDSHLIKPIKL